MSKYRVTFYGLHDNQFKTLLVAKDLQDACRIVNEVLEDGNGVFEVEGKSNRHFRANQYEFIEYELISKENSFLEKVKNINIEDFKLVIQSFENNYDLAILLGNAEEELKEFFWKAMDDERKDNILAEIESLIPIKIDETIMAEEELLQHISLLKTEGKIENS